MPSKPAAPISEGLHYGFNDLFKDDRPAGSSAKFEANVIRAGIAYKF
jgi:hypothetical protein